MDITSFKNVNYIIKKHKPSIIINCAAYTDVDISEREKKKAYKLNCEAIKNIVKICKSKSIYLIHFSTDYVFNGKKGNYKETDKTNPINYYGKTKKIGEKIISDELNNFVIFRLSWLISNYNNNFLKKIIFFLKNKKNIYMVKDQISNPTTTNLVSKVVKMCCENYYDKKNVFRGVFHLANEPSITKLNFTNYIYNKLIKLNLTKNLCKINGISSKDIKSAAKRPLNSSFNLKKIKAKIMKQNLNWKIILNKNLKNFK